MDYLVFPSSYHEVRGISRVARLRNFVLLIVAAALILAGCSSSKTKFRLSRPDAHALDSILAALRLNYDLTSTLRIPHMVVTIEDKNSKEEVRESLWYKQSPKDGELLHIQALGPLNEPRVIVIAARKHFLLYFHNEQEALFRPLADGVLSEIFGMDLRISDVRSAIFANPFLDGRTDALELASTGGKYVVQRPGVKDGQIEKIEILVQENEPIVSDWTIQDKRGRIIQRTIFSDYRDADGILRPHQVEIERQLEHTRVVLQLSKPEINGDVSDSKFDFEPFLSQALKIRT